MDLQVKVAHLEKSMTDVTCDNQKLDRVQENEHLSILAYYNICEK